jgi:hypothetical protein
MIFNWYDFIHFTDQLIAMKDDRECCIRTCVSRAYYGVFCIARDKKGYRNYYPETTDDPPVHKKVIGAYKDSNDPEEKRIGRKLDGLKFMRIDADYKDNIIHHPSYAKKAVLEAKGIMQILQKL